MQCPNCNHSVSENQSICPHCGAPLSKPESNELDSDLVFSNRYMPKNKNTATKKIVIGIIAAIIVCAVVIGVMWFMQRKNSSKASPAQQHTTAAATTEPAAAASTAVETTAATQAVATTAAPTPEQQAAEEKIKSYVDDSDIYEVLLAEADGNMQVNITVERNLLIARYTVQANSQADEDQEYINTLDGYFNELCGHLDRAVYELKEQSGVENAAIEVVAVDKANNTLFTQLVN